MDTQSNLLKITARLVLATLIVLVMVAGKTFLVPFTWALIIALSSVRMIDKLEARTIMPRGLIILLFLISLLSIFIFIGYFFYFELSHIFQDLPALSRQISARLHEISIKLAGMGINIPDHIDKSYINEWVDKHNDLIMNALSGLGADLWDIILIMFYLFFLLYYRDLVYHFFTRKIANARKLISIREKFERSLDLVKNYIYGLLLLTLISAIMNYAVFLVFGLKFALFFAVFLAILNLIPFIGNPIGLVVIMLFAIVTKESMMVPLLIFIALFIMNFLQDNVIRPWLMGDKLKVNAFIVFVAIIIGGMIWGVSGMILFIPIAGTIRILLEGHEIHGPYAVFFSEVPKKPKPAKPSGKKPEAE